MLWLSTKSRGGKFITILIFCLEIGSLQILVKGLLKVYKVNVVTSLPSTMRARCWLVDIDAK